MMAGVAARPGAGNAASKESTRRGNASTVTRVRARNAAAPDGKPVHGSPASAAGLLASEASWTINRDKLNRVVVEVAPLRQGALDGRRRGNVLAYDVSIAGDVGA